MKFSFEFLYSKLNFMLVIIVVNALALYNLYSPKNVSNTKTQQYKHKYKQSENNAKSITVVDTWYWSINKISYIIIFVLCYW